jgi:hypothetical protein
MASIDIDISDLLWNMSDYEKQELVDDLYEDGFTPNGLPEKNVSIDGDAFDEAVSKLLGNSWRLTKEDEETILLIANKLCYVS